MGGNYKYVYHRIEHPYGPNSISGSILLNQLSDKLVTSADNRCNDLLFGFSYNTCNLLIHMSKSASRF